MRQLAWITRPPSPTSWADVGATFRGRSADAGRGTPPAPARGMVGTRSVTGLVAVAVAGIALGATGERPAQAAPPATSELRIGGDVVAGMLKPLFAGTQLRLTKSTRGARAAGKSDTARSLLRWSAALGGQGADFEVPSAFVPLEGGTSLELAPNDIALSNVTVARAGDAYDVTFLFEEEGAEIRAVPTAGAPEPLPELHLANMQLTLRLTPGVSVRGRPVIAAAVASFTATPRFAGACELSARGKKIDACPLLTAYVADLGAAVADAVSARVNDGVFRANLGEAWWDALRTRLPSGNPMWVRFDGSDALVTYSASAPKDLTAAR